MKIHITQITKKFLPENVYKTAERGIIEILGKPNLKTYSVTGKMNKLGNMEKFAYMDAPNLEIACKDKTKNLKWNGFKLL